MASVQMIRELVERYVSDKISVSDLGNGFLPHLRSALVSQDQELKDLAVSVHMQLSQHSHGLYSPEELRKNLSMLLLCKSESTYPVIVVMQSDPEPSKRYEAFVDSSGQLMPA